MAESSKVSNLEEVVEGCLDGHTILLVEGESQASLLVTRVGKEEAFPSLKGSSSRGPREGFTETLRTNTSLLRRKSIILIWSWKCSWAENKNQCLYSLHCRHCR